jgi:hypothetical protein
MNIDCERCSMRVHVFGEDPINKFIEYLRLFRAFSAKIFYFA